MHASTICKLYSFKLYFIFFNSSSCVLKKFSTEAKYVLLLFNCSVSKSATWIFPLNDFIPKIESIKIFFGVNTFICCSKKPLSVKDKNVFNGSAVFNISFFKTSSKKFCRPFNLFSTKSSSNRLLPIFFFGNCGINTVGKREINISLSQTKSE